MDAPTVQNLSKGFEIVICDPMMKVVNLVVYKERDIQNCINSMWWEEKVGDKKNRISVRGD